MTRSEGENLPRLALASGGVRTPERLAALQAEMRELFSGCRRLLFIPWALEDHAGTLRGMQERGFGAGFELQGIHACADPMQAVNDAEGVFIGGGNSFRLLHALQRHGVLDLLRQRVLGGLPYLGISAGSNVACPTIGTTNDMPIVEPPRGFGALALVPFQINPHYFTGSSWLRAASGEYEAHFGETRDERIAQYHECQDRPVVGLWEGAILRVRGGDVRLVYGSARVFRRGLAPADYAAPCALPL